MHSLFVLFRSIQQGLIGNVTPHLRAVHCFKENKKYGIIFYYDPPLTEEEQELASLTDTEFISDFPDDETSCTIEIVSYPNAIPKKGFCVYKRYEENFDPSLCYSNNEEIEKYDKSLISPKSILILFRAAQKALLGIVTPNLRAVWTFMEDKIYKMTFFYDQSLSENEEKLVELASEKFHSYFSDVQTACEVKFIPYPKDIPQKGDCVYMRYENDVG